MWTGLISQAGITLGLASVLATEFPTWGSRVQMLLIAVIAIDELIGPPLFRIGLARAGEIETTTRRPLIVVSNREPYLHNYEKQGGIVVSPATGGVAVALDALMRERDGVWIAHGDGTADRAVVDAADKVRVPPDSPSYQLRRLWLDPEEYGAYYGGFANEGLWPLCHLVDVRPKFRSEEWAAYQSVNARFAAAIDEELPTTETPVFIQDYHLALVAERLRERRPTARTALFWHIPWPYPDRLRICPWRREILTGLLANDLVAFQLESDRRNFVLAVEDELDAEIEADGQRIWFRDRVSTVTAVPIGVDYDRIQGVGGESAVVAEQQRLREAFGLEAGILRPGRRSSRLHEGHSRAAGSARSRLHPSSRASRPADVSPDRRAVAIESRQLQRDRIGDRSEGPGGERTARDSRPAAAGLLPQRSASAAEPRRPLSARALLHRELAARRDEPGRQGVRRRA